MAGIDDRDDQVKTGNVDAVEAEVLEIESEEDRDPRRDRTSAEADDHGRAYWLFRNTTRGLGRFARRHKRFATVSTLGILLFLFLGRAYVHPAVIQVRKVFFPVLLALLVLLVLWFILRRSSWKARTITAVVLAGLVALAWLLDVAAYQYVRLFVRYNTLTLEELVELPITHHERIQPLNSVFSLAHEVMDETESPTPPKFVRVEDDYRWSFAVEPAYPIRRTLGEVKEIFSIPGTTPAATLSRDNRVPVRFDVGENLLFGRKSSLATIKNFGLARYLSYEPASVTYVMDDNGKWVQVVSLIRWSGFLFPRPEFGGVQLIRQTEGGFFSNFAWMLFGAGEWIKAEDVSKHEFLVGQNILSDEVSRFMANSFRFQNGFWAPFPGYHRGDIRIPNLASDVNDQPFTGYFEVERETETGGLFHYFALEPYDPDKQGLNTSLFVPADGLGPVYVYRHHARSGSLTGVSAISTKVMESKKNYDWSRNRPVEHRPFIRRIQGIDRFFWLTTVVTFKEENDRFIAGSIPDVVLTDAAYNTAVWVDPLDQDGWEEELSRSLGALWAQE